MDGRHKQSVEIPLLFSLLPDVVTCFKMIARGKGDELCCPRILSFLWIQIRERLICYAVGEDSPSRVSLPHQRLVMIEPPVHLRGILTYKDYRL